MKKQAKHLRNWTAICVGLSSCASAPVARTIPPVEVCSLRPTRAICRDRRKSNDEYSKSWEEMIGTVCIPAVDLNALLDAISE